MKSTIHLVGTRLVPALLTAAGVVLLTAGLLSYGNPATAGVVPSPSQEAVIETLSPSDEPSFEVSPPPESSPPVGPSPSGSAGPSATPEGTTPASIKPDPTKKPGRALATRVVVPALNIDLPVIKGNDGYPYCDVAMFLHTGTTVNDAAGDAFGQPGEGRATYLYAHARDGMFGPIYELAIPKDNPRKMLGMVVEVYTSDFKLYLYEIRDVRRHATTLDGPLSASKEEMWLQTSEGPKGTPGKTQLRAFLISVSGADPKESTPKAKPVKCG
ncbi:MAG TPA: hypothetical protein VES19_09880 [Candidatus Limnocylindrales bacterium]|nr:hypothetical protein [Candidatus Limnocylindrales bacterium]